MSGAVPTGSCVSPQKHDGGGIRFTQRDDGNEDAGTAEQDIGDIEDMAVQGNNSSSQYEHVADVDVSQEEEMEGGNRPACWLGDIQKITTVELLMGRQEYPTPKSETNNAHPRIVVDSGASCSVAGLPWLKAWYRFFGTNTSAKSIQERLKSSDKRFKFGNQMTFDSMGCVTLCGKVPIVDDKRSNRERTLMIHVDVVD